MQDGEGACLFWKHKNLTFTFWGLPARSVLSSQGSPHYQMDLGRLHRTPCISGFVLLSLFLVEADIPVTLLLSPQSLWSS